MKNVPGVTEVTKFRCGNFPLKQTCMRSVEQSQWEMTVVFGKCGDLLISEMWAEMVVPVWVCEIKKHNILMFWTFCSAHDIQVQIQPEPVYISSIQQREGPMLVFSLHCLAVCSVENAESFSNI